MHELLEVEIFLRNRVLSGVRVSEARVRFGIRDDTFDILNVVAESEESPPTMRLNIFKDEASARVGRVAPDDAGRQDRSDLLHVPQRDVLHVN